MKTYFLFILCFFNLGALAQNYEVSISQKRGELVVRGKDMGEISVSFSKVKTYKLPNSEEITNLKELLAKPVLSVQSKDSKQVVLSIKDILSSKYIKEIYGDILNGYEPELYHEKLDEESLQRLTMYYHEDFKPLIFEFLPEELCNFL